MKTKLFLIVIFAAFAVWSFAANHPNTRSVEQRLEALEKTVAAQKVELDKLRPLGERFLIFPDGIQMYGSFQANYIMATHWMATPLLYYGDSVQWP